MDSGVRARVLPTPLRVLLPISLPGTIFQAKVLAIFKGVSPAADLR